MRGTRQATPHRAAEWRHRARLTTALAVLLVLSAVALFGHDLAGPFAARLADADHVGFVCLIALHEILAPVHRAFHLLILSGFAYAVVDRARTALALRRSLTLVSATAPRPGTAFWDCALSVGLRPERVRIVEGLPTPAFTAGWWRPRVFVARSLADRLEREELAAVLAHEGVHVRRRDPLAFAALRFLSHVLWWLPPVRALADDIVDEAEVTADDRAATRRPLALASALVNLAHWGQFTNVGLIPRFTNHGRLLERRVRRLVGEAGPVSTHMTRARAVSGAILLAWLLLSGLVMVHPLHAIAMDEGRTRHCAHHHGLALSHLFCPGFAARIRHVAVCPHATGEGPAP